MIAGAGIAGTVTAMALQRVGISARVFEAYGPTEPERGSYFTITANGLEALRQIDALDAAMSVGFPTRRNVLWNHRGKRLAEISLDSSIPGSPPAQTVKRSRLARVLQDEALRRGIPIEFDRRLVDVDETDGAWVLARFRDGSEARGDVLVGADGVHSVVRRAIDPSAPSARYVGLTNFGGVTQGAADGIEPEAWHLIFGTQAFFGYQATPAGDVIWFANLPRPLIGPEERARTAATEWQRILAKSFQRDEGRAAELIDAGRLELVADNTHDLGHVPVWHRGPLVIVGDAAHAPAPTSGQGASMAIEDGIVLGRSLRDESSVAAAFARYERERRERVERIVRAGARGSSSKAPGRFGRVVRDALIPLLFRYVITEKAVRWMYDYRVTLEEPVQLKAA